MMQLGVPSRYNHLTYSHVLAIIPRAADHPVSFPSQQSMNASSYYSSNIRILKVSHTTRHFRRSCCFEAAIPTAAVKTDADSKGDSSQQKFAERPLLRNAIIVGGGIAGLTAAIALRRQGVDVQVYEKAEGRDPERVGRMVGIQPNGLAALRCIDPTIADAFPSQGAHVPSLWQLSPSGEVLLEAMAPADGRLSIRWGLALEVLQSFLPASCVHQGCEFTGHVEQANGHVTAHFTRHEQPFSAEADLLIGTDGVRSAVRQHVLREGEERERWGPPRDNGRTMWLGAAPRETVSFEHSRPYRTCFTRGGGRTAAVGDLGGAEIFVLFVCADEQGRGLTQQRSANGEEVRGKIRALFADWPAYKDVIEAVPPGLYLERRVLDVPPLPRWRNGRILIIGDAAHAVPPTLGQGSSLAIEDALELARQVVADHPSLEVALDAFEAERAPRVAWVAEASVAVAGQAYKGERDPNAPAEGSVNPDAALGRDQSTRASSSASGGNSSSTGSGASGSGNDGSQATDPVHKLYSYERLNSPLVPPPWASSTK